MSKFQCLTVLTVVAVLSQNLVSQDKTPQGGLLRGSQVTGLEIRNAENTKIGTIEDVVFDRDAGTIAFAIVSFGPEINTGDKLVAVPWGNLKPASDAKSLSIDLSKDRLEKAPSFAKDAWPDMNAQWTSEVHAFYGSSPLPVRETARREPLNDDLARARTENGNRKMTDDRNRPADPNRPMTDDRAAANANGNRPAQSHDVTMVSGKVSSFTDGDPSRLVVTTGTGEVRAELAPTAFLDQQKLVFDGGSDVTLRGYETSRDGDRTFIVTEVVMKDGRTVRLRGADFAPLWTSDRVRTDRHDEQVATAAEAYDLRDLSGTVTHVEGAGPCNESAQGRLITVRTAQGDRTIALGPGEYLSRNRFEFRPQETVSVKGWEADYMGRRIFFATEVRRGNDTLRLRRNDGTPLW